jgi:hypothetical protein
VITLHLQDKHYIALQSDYAHKDAIKALAPYPDVQFCAEARAWLVHVALLDKLYFYLGDAIAPASPSFWLVCPLYAPQPAAARRRSKQQIMAEKREQQAAATKWGTAIVEMKR